MNTTLDDYLGQGTDHGTETAYNCPFCERVGKSKDTEEKLYVNYDKDDGVFICFRCETKGPISYLLQLLGAPEAESSVVQLQELYTKLNKLRGIIPADEEEITCLSLPDYTEHLIDQGCIALTEGSAAHSYLKARGMTPEQMEFYRFAEGRGRYKGRVIVPTFERDNTSVVFFVSRAYRPSYYFKNGVKKEAPKYLNPSGLGRSESLFNLYNALDYSPDRIILAEGVFSAIAAGYEGIASYGKHVSDSQIELLSANVGSREVIVCLDGDAHTEGVHAAERIANAGVKNVSFVALPYKEDPDSLRYDFGSFLDSRFKLNPVDLIKLQLDGRLLLKSKVKKGPVDKAPSCATLDSIKSRLLKA